MRIAEWGKEEFSSRNPEVRRKKGIFSLALSPEF
jgi:hypothetical protein